MFKNALFKLPPLFKYILLVSSTAACLYGYFHFIYTHIEQRFLNEHNIIITKEAWLSTIDLTPLIIITAILLMLWIIPFIESILFMKTLVE